ncbi:hypothetical protein D3C74_378430 [compost metagenome]
MDLRVHHAVLRRADPLLYSGDQSWHERHDLGAGAAGRFRRSQPDPDYELLQDYPEGAGRSGFYRRGLILRYFRQNLSSAIASRTGDRRPVHHGRTLEFLV